MANVLRFPETRPKPDAATPPSDAVARAAALDTRSSCIVEAPAGSGKTGLLVQRFLKLLADPDTAQPEEVLAMTFTRKATTEMQQRVLEHLQAANARHHLPENASPFNHATRALAEAVLARDAQFGWNLLAQPQRLNIRSILSVCLEIANSLPLLSGSGAPREPLDDARPLYRLAARRTLLQLGGADIALHNALRTVLLHRDGSLDNVETLLAAMLDSRDQWGELIPLDATSLNDAALDLTVRPKLERTLESIVCAGLTRTLHALPSYALQELTALAARLGLAPGLNGKPSPIALCAGKHDPPEAVADHLDHWRALIHLLLKPSDHNWRVGYARNHLGFEIAKPDAAYLKELVQQLQSEPLREVLHAVRNLPPACYPDEQWAVARALFHVLRHALVELKLLFSERNQCDYTELALAAREALRSSTDPNDSTPDTAYTVSDIAYSPSDIALAAGGHLRHLLVDEMQDTSATQYELIQLLTASWDGHSQTLFLVGDPKQSIYLFRQATVARFLRTLAEGRLGDIPLTPLRLTANFRSQATLVHAFNHTFGADHPFGRIFPPPPSSSQTGDTHATSDVPFVAATPTRPATIPHAIHWHTSVFGEEPYDPTLPLTGVPAADCAAAEARHIRRLIEQRLATPLPADRNDPHKPKPWRIAILARARHHLAAIVQELKAHNGRPAIPFRAVDLDPLDQLPEILDVLALTRALLHPADRIAWLAVLHAPWCGLGLADLLALTGEASLEPQAAPESDSHATVATLVRTRRQHLSPLGQQLLDRAWPTLETAAATLGRTLLSVHVERTWRSLGGDAPLTPEQQSNVRRFLAVLRDLESEPSLDLLTALTARLKDLYAEPISGDNIQVELLTIHKAKGLEWDFVFLPGLHRPTRPNGSGLLNWIELDNPLHDAETSSSDAPSSDHEASILLAPIWGKGNDSDQLNHWLRDLRAARERAEEKRLFYVAATRAREQLHLFAALSRKQDGSLASPLHGTLLKACWPAVEPHFAPFAARSEPLGTGSPSPVNGHRLDSSDHDLLDSSFVEPDLALAASADPGSPTVLEPFANSAALDATSETASPTIQRLPLSFDPTARFTAAAAHRLPYAPATALSRAPAFDRPEGSFAVRAFGNVVHRYLQVLAARLTDSITSDALLTELPTWEPRLTASLRGEGLPPAEAARQATRALRALTLTLNDPTGRWILTPHPLAASEQSLTLPTLHNLIGATSSLRIDRTFLAGPTPLSIVTPAAETAHLWIVDFKTTDPGSRSPQAFAAAEIAKYAPQLEAYASLRRSLPGGDLPIRLALFYPLIPRLLDWPFSPAAQPSPVSPQPLPQEVPTPISSLPSDILS